MTSNQVLDEKSPELLMLNAPKKSGFSLIEVMVGVALLGSLILIAAKAMTLAIGTQEKLTIMGEREDIKTALRAELDCTATMGAIGTKCDGKLKAANYYVPLLGKNGSFVVGKYPKEIIDAGNFHYTRSKCIDDGAYYRFEVEERRQKKGVPLTAPLTKLRSEWTPLFHNVPVVCPKPLMSTIVSQFVFSDAGWYNCLSIQNVTTGKPATHLGCNYNAPTNIVKFQVLPMPACNTIRLTFTSNGNYNVSTKDGNWPNQLKYWWIGPHKLQVGLDDDAGHQHSWFYEGFNDFVINVTKAPDVLMTIEGSGMPCR